MDEHAALGVDVLAVLFQPLDSVLHPDPGNCQRCNEVGLQHAPIFAAVLDQIAHLALLLCREP